MLLFRHSIFQFGAYRSSHPDVTPSLNEATQKSTEKHRQTDRQTKAQTDKASKQRRGETAAVAAQARRTTASITNNKRSLIGQGHWRLYRLCVVWQERYAHKTGLYRTRQGRTKVEREARYWIADRGEYLVIGPALVLAKGNTIATKPCRKATGLVTARTRARLSWIPPSCPFW